MKKLAKWRETPSSIQKIVRAMKISVLLVLVSTLQLSASVMFGQQVSLKMGKTSVRQVFKELKTQTGTFFMYSEEEIDRDLTVKIDFSDVSLEEALEEICGQASLQYEIVDDYVLITKKPIVVEKETQQEKKEIKGVVTDDQGMPMPGVSVIVKGTLFGAATDFEGFFRLALPEDAKTLVFSAIGMDTQEFVYTGQVTLNVSLKYCTEGLDEVVVVGYGSSKKERIGSAISTVKAAEIEMKSAGVIGFEQMLGGNVKGVKITQNSGAPGATSTVRVRGITSPFSGGNNQPLYVIDGVPLNSESVGGQNPLESISPSDIKSLTVLKDAGATAIYGSRGANGVIIIKTKRGARNAGINVSFDASLSISNPIKTMDVLDAKGFKDLQVMVANNTLDAYEAGNLTEASYNQAASIVNPNGRSVYETYTDAFTGEEMPLWGTDNTDWQKEIYRKNAPVQKYNLNISGGNKKTNYSASVYYNYQKGLVQRDYQKRYGARLSLDTDVKEWLRLGTSLNFGGSKNYAGRNTSLGNGSPSEAMTERPDYGVYKSMGVFQRIPGEFEVYGPGLLYPFSQNNNPRAGLENEDLRNSRSFFGNTYVELAPIKDLKVRTSLSVSDFNTEGRNFIPLRALAKTGFETNALTNSTSGMLSTALVFQVDYNKVLDKHRLDAMAGYSIDRSYSKYNAYSFNNTKDDDVLNIANTGSFVNTSGGRVDNGMNSIYSRFQYSYDGKYTLTLNMRSDASSKFGPENKRGYFPSIAANWNVTEESFMKDLSFMNNLKLRTSYGKTGSANIADFSYLKYFGAGEFPDLPSYMGNKIIVPSNIFPNVNVKWETTKELNLGVDFAFLNNKIEGSVDYYDKQTSDALMPAPIYHEGGATDFTDNRAEISNRGMEFDLNVNILRTKNWSWSSSFNLSFNRNKVENLKDLALPVFLADNYVVGEPIGVIMGYEVEKIIQTQQEIIDLNTASPIGTYDEGTTGAGDYMYKDQNGDQRINVEDQVVLGSQEADFFGGFSTRLAYKNFSFTAGFQYSVGNEKIWRNHGDFIGSASFMKNASKDALTKTWRQDNMDAKYTRLVFGPSNNTSVNNRNIQDASYLRLKVLNLSYQLPQQMLDKLKLKGMSFYMAGTNLLTFTKYEGLDPEGSLGGFIESESSSRDSYPFARTYTLGMKIQF